MRSILAAIVALSTLGISSAAEKVLLPIHVREVPGAFGSVWTSFLSVTNHSTQPIVIFGLTPCELAPCLPEPVPGGSSFSPCEFRSFAEAEADDISDVSFLLRVQDLSRQSETWGTVIPTVRERNATLSPGRLELLDVPVSNSFRAMLRVYSFLPGVEAFVRLRAYAPASSSCLPTQGADALIHDSVQTLKVSADAPLEEPPILSLALATISEIEAYERVRIEVEPITTDVGFWAFVSVTNNETQHMTAIIPQ